MPRSAVALLALLLAGAAPAPVARAADASGTIDLAGAVERPAHLTPEHLKALPPTSLRVFFHTGHGPVNAVFTGVSLWSLLDAAGVVPAKGRAEALRKVVVARGADGYLAVLALGELSPELGGRDAIVALLQDGTPLAAPRLVVPGDKGGGRNVVNLVALDVRLVPP